MTRQWIRTVRVQRGHSRRQPRLPGGTVVVTTILIMLNMCIVLIVSMTVVMTLPMQRGAAATTPAAVTTRVIVIATPGRLMDLFNQRLINFNDITIFTLDEADRMLDMGFIMDVRRIVAKLPTKRQTLNRFVGTRRFLGRVFHKVFWEMEYSNPHVTAAESTGPDRSQQQQSA